MDKDKFNIEEIENLLRDCLKRIELTRIDQENYLNLNCVINNYRHLLSIDNPVINRDLLKDTEKNVERKFGSNARTLYHQALVYQLYLENAKNINYQNLPQGVLNYLKNDFSRIINLANKGESKFLTFNDFQFFSYVQKLCFKCFPVGNQNLSISGFSRSLIFRQFSFKAVSFARLILCMRGNYPLFELHYNPHRFRSFNPEGWNEVFLLAAQMMGNHPEIKGVFGGTWFYDPAIKAISPELYYIRELIEKIGGQFFLVSSSEQDRKNAFAFSKVRKVAYEEGRYIPTSYMTIIPRAVLLSFYGL